MSAAARAVVPLGLIGAVAILVLAGGDALSPPPLSVEGFVRWADERDVATAGVALARVAALLVAAWLAALSGVSLVARVVGAARLGAAAERALPAPVRRALAGMAGAGFASVVAFGTTAGQGGGDDAPPVATEPLVLLPADGEGTATMSVLPDEPAGAVAERAAAVDHWTVEPGESFWSIAESVVSEAIGRAPADAEVDPYWRSLIAANRHLLVTSDPDLIRPGQVFVLPPVT